MTRRFSVVPAICPVTSKFGFESRRAARSKMRNWRGAAGFHGQNVYRCEHPGCGMWHITSQAKRKAA